MAVNPETYPGTTVFINKLGLRESKRLAEAEATFTFIRTEEYRDGPLDGAFDLKHLRAIHHHLFQDLYNWAGRLRSDDTRKGICEFTPANKIEHYATQIYTELAAENHLQGLEHSHFVRRLAYYYDLTNRLHPFPEGNGRTQRLFTEHLATIAGYSLDWSSVHAWEIVETAEQSFKGNGEPLILMFDRIVQP